MPTQDPQLDRLTTVVDLLRETEPVQPDAEFRTALRTHLVALAAAVPNPRTGTATAPDAPIAVLDPAATGPDDPDAPTATIAPGAGPDDAETDADADGAAGATVVELAAARQTRRPGGPDGLPRRWRRPRLGLAAASLTLLAAAGLAVAGSRNALPGDPLYALKRGTESAGLAFARGDESRGRRYLDLAQVRAGEVRDLAGRGGADPATFVDTLGSMDEQTKAGVRLLTGSAVDRVADGPLIELGTWTVQQYDLLLATAPKLPAQAQPRLRDSVALLRRVGDRVVELRARLGCGCLAGGARDDLGPQPCNPCGTVQTPASSTPSGPAPSRTTSLPGRSGGPGRTAAPSSPPRTSGRPGSGPTRGGSGGGRGRPPPRGVGGLPLPLPLPTSGGNVPLPSIPGLPLPSSLPLPLPLPLPVPLPTSGLPLPTGLLPGLLPGPGGG